MTYFYTRLFRAEMNKLCMLTLDGNSTEDSLWTRIFAYTGYLTIFCHIPYLVVNLVSGSGTFIPAPAHFGAYVIKYSSTILLCIFYIFTVRSQRDYNEKECCWLLIKKEGSHNCMTDIHHRLMTKKNISQSNSIPGSSYNEGSTIRSATIGSNLGACAETELWKYLGMKKTPDRYGNTHLIYVKGHMYMKSTQHLRLWLCMKISLFLGVVIMHIYLNKI